MNIPFDNSELPQNINNLMNEINEIEGISAEKQKNAKVARLIVLLINIEKELNTVNSTLHKLLGHQMKHNPRSPIIAQITEKLNTVDRLTGKIQKARLNLNYYFV